MGINTHYRAKGAAIVAALGPACSLWGPGVSDAAEVSAAVSGDQREAGSDHGSPDSILGSDGVVRGARALGASAAEDHINFDKVC